MFVCNVQVIRPFIYAARFARKSLAPLFFTLPVVSKYNSWRLLKASLQGTGLLLGTFFGLPNWFHFEAQSRHPKNHMLCFSSRRRSYVMGPECAVLCGPVDFAALCGRGSANCMSCMPRRVDSRRTFMSWRLGWLPTRSLQTQTSRE